MTVLKRVLIAAVVMCMGRGALYAAPTEMQKVLGVVPPAEATAVAKHDGNWSDPATWNDEQPPDPNQQTYKLTDADLGKVLEKLRVDQNLTQAQLDAVKQGIVNGFGTGVVAQGPIPQDGDFVWIPKGRRVSLDHDTARLDRVFIQGALDVPDAAKVKLSVSTLVTDMGASFGPGAMDSPFAGKLHVLFIDQGPIDPARDPWMMSRGAHFMHEFAFVGSMLDAHCDIFGAKAGDTVLRLKNHTEMCEGWAVGQEIYVPSTSWKTKLVNGQKYLIREGDAATIAGLDPTTLSIQLAAPLKFDHPDTDREGKPRRMVACNVSESARSIVFESENKTDVSRRGHVMMMRTDVSMMMEFYDCAFIGLGRTDKSIPVTDPDGSGGGIANPRGRYAGPHWHLCKSDFGGAPGKAVRCLISDRQAGIPGWGPVNHGSNCQFVDNLVMNCRGGGMIGENGNEIGLDQNNVIICGDVPIQPSNKASDDLGNANWGRQGEGIVNISGGIEVTGNLVCECPSVAYQVMAIGFTRNGVTTKFSRLAFQTPPAADVSVTAVPFDFHGNECYSTYMGFFPASINGNGNPKASIARSQIRDFKCECDFPGVMIWYSSNIDISKSTIVRIADDYTVDESLGGRFPTAAAFHHSGTNTDVNYDDCAAYGFSVGIHGEIFSMGQTNRIANFVHKCLTGIVIYNSRQVGNNVGPAQWGRKVAITNLQRVDLSAAEMAKVKQAASVFNSGPFVQHNGAKQCDIGAYGYLSPYMLRTGPATVVPEFVATYPDFLSEVDKITLDGQRIFYSEEDPAFPWAKVANCPPQLKSLTNAQAQQQFRLAIGNRILPADAVPLAGSNCMVSPSGSAPSYFPEVKVTKSYTPLFSRQNYQITNNATAYVAEVQDAAGNKYLSTPAGLVNKTMNLIPVTVAGVQRWVIVYCDTSLTTVPSPW